MASKLSVSSVRGSIKALLEESSGEKKRNFVETVSVVISLYGVHSANIAVHTAVQVELQIGLKNYDPQRDKRFSGTIK